jgi:hypothetical protein
MKKSLTAKFAAILCFSSMVLVAKSGTAQDMTAKACTAETGADRAFCVTMIGAMRPILSDQKIVCSPVAPNDLSDTYAVIGFIRAHPERQSEKIGAITEEVLKKMHPCL